METLDQIDQALIDILERNARTSVVALARGVGLSRSAVQERLARLERSGAIEGYTLRLGKGLSRARHHAWLMVSYAVGVNCATVTPRIRPLREIRSIFSLAGTPDLLVEIMVDTADELDGVVDRIRRTPGVKSVSTHVVLAHSS
jgi:Lrp/AsnC family leucine-responsive transcriptional regulator